MQLGLAAGTGDTGGNQRLKSHSGEHNSVSKIIYMQFCFGVLNLRLALGIWSCVGFELNCVASYCFRIYV